MQQWFYKARKTGLIFRLSQVFACANKSQIAAPKLLASEKSYQLTLVYIIDNHERLASLVVARGVIGSCDRGLGIP